MHKNERLAHFLSLLLAASLLGACQRGDETGPEATATENAAASFLPANPGIDSGCDNGGELYTELYGALEGEIEWYLDQMQCQGMPRPDGNGARLRFAGEAGSDAMPIAFIIGIPGLERGMDGIELASNVTVIDERTSRFFSTSDLDSCWTDVEGQWPVEEKDNVFRIDGVLYCISPLAEVNGETSISIPELRFSGLLDWGAR